MKMNPVVHFEMPYENRDRAALFYEEAFGWKATKLGADMGNYMTVNTTETDDKTGQPKQSGAINGGMYAKMKDLHSVSIVISVDDVHESMKKISELGGKVLGGQKPGEPDDIPGVGLYSAFIDTEGNRVGILQPKPMGTNQSNK